MHRPLTTPRPLITPGPRRLAASLACGVMLAAVLTTGSAGAVAPAVPRADAPEPCAAITDRFESGLCYFETAKTLEDCSPRWRRVMAEVVASGAVQFFVNPLEHCSDTGARKARQTR
ncbi:hypothetical protein [Streptomyces formicae]|uniref:Secreted protein n=1 Tax=Streptomyces formicae TaxID=1616117 RepID=A0A291Q2K3_9ACTN|nr:hypothetical protein [Streptomyces formicae]ATL25753.1 hypothetical protein KY5_0735c [Streptomyces formicae]